MSSCTNLQSNEVVEHLSRYDALSTLIESPSKPDENEEEDEDEDVDFNPFLKETPSPEASSSLSSEIEELEGDVVDDAENTYGTLGSNSSRIISEVEDCTVGVSENGEEEIVMQTTGSPEGAHEKGYQKIVPIKKKKRKFDHISQPDIGTAQEKCNGSSSGNDVNDVVIGEFSDPTWYEKPTSNDEDAICKRTRAHFSLASFTLDELEAFLQETDDEDNLQNVDDEEEYRKFLAAVLQGKDSDGQIIEANGNVDDDDEDNDADFEIELEEMLESEIDESTVDRNKKEEYGRSGRRPETRQNRRQKASDQYKKRLLEQAKRPLRPLVPILPNGANLPLSTPNETASRCGLINRFTSSAPRNGLINGFTPHQIAQLHCLIHEHMQLLIQIYSLSVLDLSQQHIASQVQGLIFKMLHKRDEVMACRTEPYSGDCFRSQYMCSSVPDEFAPAQCFPESSSTYANGAYSPRNVQMPASHYSLHSDRRFEYVSKEPVASFPTVEGSLWMPIISGQVRSVLDVAPLNLVEKYMDDVYTAAREYRRRLVESYSDTLFEKEPLFPLPCLLSAAEANSEVLRGTVPPTITTIPDEQPPKKTLAATLVEKTKKQSVALVPKEIAKLAQRFISLFNPALFPHNPPPTAVANRVLFTESEDELLALGLLEYNSDWKAIQKRFLPCKSKHQIFVRQKNRCSSKAPENSIKAVRRMKASPLTAEEIEAIQEGLTVFKHDWMSVWKFVVPHRDPSSLPRQWRMAVGTQKSYKQDAAKKEKRRIYESRRRWKTAELANWQPSSDKEDFQAEITVAENNNGDNDVNTVSKPYVHEAFLADWRPCASNLISPEYSCSNLRERIHPHNAMTQECTNIREQPNNESIDFQHRSGHMHKSPNVFDHLEHPSKSSHLTHVIHGVPSMVKPNYSVSEMTSNSSKSRICLWPYRTRKFNNSHLVKLAPDLPPLNLPPSVRVISQSAFQGDKSGSFTFSGTGVGDAGKGNTVSQLHVAKEGTATVNASREKSNQLKGKARNLLSEECRVAKDKTCEEERATYSDLQMHPLLFQAPEEGCLTYYPLDCGASSSFSFFSGNQPQLNLSLFHNPLQSHHAVDRFNKSQKIKDSMLASCGIDFHPLLQRTDYANSQSVTAFSTAHVSVGLDDQSAQLHNPSDVVQSKSLVNGGSLATDSAPSSSNERVEELDLEIHLSSITAKEKALGSRDMTAHARRSTVSVPCSGNTMEMQNASSPCCTHGENFPGVCSKLVSGSHPLVIPSNNISGCNVDNFGDQSHQEIVMEQEELSDSDEEVEEHVEFECEEMDDSEGEEDSHSEQIANMQDKEVPSSEAEKVATGADCDDQQWDLSTHAQSKACGGSHHSEFGLTSLGEDTSSSWLSLNSCAAACPAFTKTNYEEIIVSEDPAVTKSTSCHSTRSCKKTAQKKLTVQKHAIDMAQQLSLGPLAVTTVRKPRKRACRAKRGMKIGMTSEISRGNGKD
ncbi:Myb_DNA-bind_6 domain-containing protein [Cephalotus follicularis]|uniref:Myb_DNA-bind_6 domain-containing protein n=1 Tax=Cephalotus follicularis TaxID=3775 RepID=A0A1Q3CXZ9_CEPFO|nr:Myb_DNA-bind_6 domain-containing protein [Cephalotus follicularis]